MYLTAVSDEAASDIEGQIRATQELGWQFLDGLWREGVQRWEARLKERKSRLSLI
jgi:hypothetical protein